MNKTDTQFNNEVDALFRLPLPEFTGARNALAAQLKKSGRGEESVLVKALAKPSISAWAVNQLYWNHREAFDRLIASGERFHKAQTTGKVANMREALDKRREELTDLSDLATSLLRDASHNPSPDTIHRITTTLEAISAYASRDDGPRPGRLTNDVDPPGFESFGSFVPTKREAASRKQQAGAGGRRKDPVSAQRANAGDRKSEEASKAKLVAAKASLQDAKRSLSGVQAHVRSLEAAKTRAQADVRQAEERLKEATMRARSVDEDLKSAGREAAKAERRVAKASSELDSL